ncbi:hypothetical protein [Agrococcus jejuensis]|uniref:PH domain-containing protein n=1 Tax=Agrococcus jejuensis TaxID=399736 RepID=A0A1G8A465_9MICO|nr:hypothetical protein [Agrococcus jejuensis]SDH15765.1 hypothetical protein SAMN04489720_0242 [Agrococcus jejuensis]
MHPAPPPVATARVVPGWQIGMIWFALVLSVLLIVGPIPFLPLPDGLLGLTLMALGTLLTALMVPIARGLVVELRLEPHRIVARRMLGAPVVVARHDVRDVVVASSFMQPRRYGGPLESMRVMLVGHEGRTLVAATWSTLRFDPPAFFAPWGMRPFLLPEPMYAPELERRVPGGTSRLERLGPAMMIVILVLLAIEAVVAGVVLLLAQVLR